EKVCAKRKTNRRFLLKGSIKEGMI
ncbi:hypothetical protein C5S36_03675, partial [Candidatus Methanophagaceae archaeon]